jgi:hypothetical protein
MQRIGTLITPLLFLLMLAIAVVAKTPGQGGLPAAARTRVEQYLAYESRAGVGEIRAAALAAKPWNLTRDPGIVVFGDSVYYQTDLGTAWGEPDSLLPLPFPPKELWCVLEQQSSPASEEQSYSVILVGLHMDMYNADWLVHVLPGIASDPGVRERLSQIGCDLGVSMRWGRGGRRVVCERL